MDITKHSKIIKPDDCAYHIGNFFDTVHKYKIKIKDSNLQNTLEYSASMVSQRLWDILQHFVLRNYIPEAKRLVGEVDAQSRDWLPCTATEYFKEIGKLVHCDSLLKNHGGGHQSSQIFFVETSLMDKLKMTPVVSGLSLVVGRENSKQMTDLFLLDGFWI
jgi:hypothetical protein